MLKKKVNDEKVYILLKLIKVVKCFTVKIG